MKSYSHHIDKGDEMEKPESTGYGWIEDNEVTGGADQDLFEETGICLTALDDLDEVRNDPGLAIAGVLADEAIKEYKNKPAWSRENAMFITSAFEQAEQEKMLEQAIREIKREINNKGVDSAAARWVNEWNEKKEKQDADDSKTTERRNFIADSLGENEKVSEPVTEYRSHRKKSLAGIFRIAAIPAAAATGLLIILKSFTGPADAGKIFASYYEPMSIVSPATRSAADNFNISYASGLEKYRSGDYDGAMISFTEALNSDASSVPARFFMGLTHLAKGNYVTAAGLLEEIAGTGSGFGKEAEWYLGLTFLKSGEKEKAVKYFRSLAGSPGYYREKAEKILRRLE